MTHYRFIIRRRASGPTTFEWIVDGYGENGFKIPFWYRAKTLKACREYIHSFDETALVALTHRDRTRYFRR
jgi:hypothetical protein